MTSIFRRRWPVDVRRRLRDLILLVTFLAIFAAPAQPVHAAFTFQRIVNSFTTTPPSEPPTATYDYVGIPAMSGGSVVFGAKTLGPAIGGSGLYDRIEVGTTAGALTNYAKRVVNPGPNPAVGTIAFFFEDPAISGNQIAARPSAFDGTNYRGQIFTYVAPNAPTNLGIAWGAPSLYVGSAAYPANRIGLNVTQLQNTFVSSADAVPGGGGATFQTFTPNSAPFDSYIDYNINYAAFTARWIDAGNVSRVGVYRWEKSTDSIVAVADKNVSIPGFPADKFDDNFAFLTTQFDNVSTTGAVQTARPSLAGTTVAFSYNETLSTPARAGVYRYAGGSLAKIADVTTPNPSSPGFNFRHFEGVSTLGSAHAFVANSVVNNNAVTASGGPQTVSIGGGYGIYLDACGMIKEVTRQGNVLDGRVISNLEIGHRALTTVKFKYNLAFRAEFTDGTEGIYVASTSSLCINPVPVLADFGHLFSMSLVQLPAAPDIGVPVETTWQTRVQQGSAGTPATVGVDFEAGFVGVNGLPGNNPNLIDFTLDSGIVAPEELVLSFSEDTLLEGLRLDQFDEADSLRLTIGGATRLVAYSDLHDGMLPLGDIQLAKGEAISIAWDGANVAGNGFSFNGLGYRVVPEPATPLMLAYSLLSLIWRRRLIAERRAP